MHKSLQLDISPYNKEQLEALVLIKDYIESLSSDRKATLQNKLKDYLTFRENVSSFFEQNLSTVCFKKCYESNISACCTHEGIITFFADMVINMLCASPAQQINIINKLKKNYAGNKCVYLEKTGCMWQVKPIVCEMFLCDSVKNEIFIQKPDLKKKWEILKQQEKHFKWPDKPVLFDELESIFIAEGFSSPLMYFHNSPGLLRIKQLSRS